MAEIQLYTFGSVVAVSLVSLIGIISISWSDSFLKKCLFFFVALAVGALLGDAFLHLIPEAVEEIGNERLVALYVLAGMLLFFLLEKIFRWHHHHGTHTEKHSYTEPVGKLVIVADAAHNFVDGIIIAASFLVSIELGIATTIAVFLHEIPQEISDFSLLIHAGFSKGRALMFNFASALTAVLGAGAVFLLANVEELIPALAAFTAGMFIYIAGVDLVPELQKRTSIGSALGQLTAILLGIGVMILLLLLE